MRTAFGIFFFLIHSSFCWASQPELTLTGKDSYNGFATVAGVVRVRDVTKVRITIRCGNTTYTTVPDVEGRWALVFRHTHFNFEVNAWDSTEPDVLLATLSESHVVSD